MPEDTPRTGRFVEKWRSRLGGERVYRVAPLVGVLLCAPSLVGGLGTDDHLHRVGRLSAEPLLARSPWDLFTLAPAEGMGIAQYVDAGILPWWMPEGANLRVWRPLASLTHWLDYTLWPGAPWLMHLQNLLWYAAAVVAVGALYRRMMAVGGWPAWVAGLATVFYAIDDAHGLAVGWIANRNALMALTFGLLALLAHERWRREGWRPGAWWAPVSLGLGLLCAEVAVSILAYFVAHALFIDQGARRGRLGALVPSVSVVVAWRALYVSLGYGNRGSGLFLDPLDAPLLFLSEAPSRAAALVFGQWGWVPSDLWVAVPEGEGHLVVIAGALIFAALIAVVIWPTLKRDPVARFWTFGAVGSMVPVCATFPMDRLLLFTGVGALAMIAQVIGGVADGAAWLPEGRRWKRRARMLAVSWTIIHGGLAPLLLPLRSLTSFFLTPSFERLSDDLGSGVGLEAQDLIVVGAPDFWSAGLTQVVRRSRGESHPARVRVLSAGFEGLSVSRPSGDTLVISRPEGLFTDPMERLFYGPHRDRRPGDTVSMVGCEAKIEAVGPLGRPTRVAYRFEGGLGHGRLRWVTWRGRGYERFELPEVGGSVALPAVDIEAIFAPQE